MDGSEEDSIIWKILRESKTIAVVGCSREEGKDSHNIPMYLQKVGYRIIPINPFAPSLIIPSWSQRTFACTETASLAISTASAEGLKTSTTSIFSFTSESFA